MASANSVTASKASGSAFSSYQKFVVAILQPVSNRDYLQGLATTRLLTVGGFMLMPFMSVFMVHNIGLPIDSLSQVPGGSLLHFDTLGYILVCTTLICLALMSLINRKIAGTRLAAERLTQVAAAIE